MAKDIIHDAVKNALIKDGWTITADPFRIEYEEFILFTVLPPNVLLKQKRMGIRLLLRLRVLLGFQPYRILRMQWVNM